jgi:predicted nucleic acid-binding protein
MGQDLMRLYLDTSVFGGCYEEQYAEDSWRVVSRIMNRRSLLLASEILIGEIERAPVEVLKLFKDLPGDMLEVIDVDEDVRRLSNAYIEAGIVQARSINDAIHVAAATVGRADAIVSWNFKHIVQLGKMRAYNAVNLFNGYGLLNIVSPREVRE